MNDEDNPKTISDDELVEVSGGGERIVRTGNRSFEYWYVCSACGEYRELIYSGSSKNSVRFSGTFTCPKCGYTRDYSLSC